MLHGIPVATGRELLWVLEETAALSRFRTDLPANARSSSAALREVDDRAGEERRAVHRLWTACVEAVRRAGASTVPAMPAPARHRDWLLAVHGVDTDAWIHPPFIRFLASYLDQGLAHWAMPERNRGIHGCFLELYGTSLATQCGQWARTLPRLVADDRDAGRSALDSIAHSLAQLGVADDEWEDYLSAELLALRGWAGIVRQIEERPDRVPARDLTVTLARIPRSPAAVRTRGAGCTRRDSSLSAVRCSDLRSHAAASASAPPGADDARARVAALSCGAALRPRCVDRGAMDRRNVAELESELRELDDLRRRRILHQAFERAIRHRLYDALMQHAPQQLPGAAGVSGDFLPRRAGGIISAPSGGSRADLRDVQHGWILQRGHVSPGRVRRAPAAALSCSDPSRITTSLKSNRTAIASRDARVVCSAAPPGFSATTCIWEAGCQSAGRC